MAVGVGFEPTEPVKVHFFSKEAHSTTLPPNHFAATVQEAVNCLSAGNSQAVIMTE